MVVQPFGHIVICNPNIAKNFDPKHPVRFISGHQETLCHFKDLTVCRTI